MRHKYTSPAFVLGNRSRRETESTVVLLTPDFGLIYVRAQGLRKPGSKLAMALQTFSESEVMLVRGREGWRLTGALLVENWAGRLTFAERKRAGRVVELMQRLVRGEHSDPRLYEAVLAFVRALPGLGEDEGEAAEVLAALRILQALGVDAGSIPGEADEYSAPVLEQVAADRKAYIARVNNGIVASGL